MFPSLIGMLPSTVYVWSMLRAPSPLQSSSARIFCPSALNLAPCSSPYLESCSNDNRKSVPALRSEPTIADRGFLWNFYGLLSQVRRRGCVRLLLGEGYIMKRDVHEQRHVCFPFVQESLTPKILPALDPKPYPAEPQFGCVVLAVLRILPWPCLVWVSPSLLASVSSVSLSMGVETMDPTMKLLLLLLLLLRLLPLPLLLLLLTSNYYYYYYYYHYHYHYYYYYCCHYCYYYCCSYCFCSCCCCCHYLLLSATAIATATPTSS